MLFVFLEIVVIANANLILSKWEIYCIIYGTEWMISVNATATIWYAQQSIDSDYSSATTFDRKTWS